jgi:hypothetical protein
VVEAGFGIGFLRATSLHLLAGTDVTAAPLAEEWADRKLVIARRDTAPISAAVAAFLDLSRNTRAPTGHAADSTPAARR